MHCLYHLLRKTSVVYVLLLLDGTHLTCTSFHKLSKDLVNIKMEIRLMLPLNCSSSPTLTHYNCFSSSSCTNPLSKSLPQTFVIHTCPFLMQVSQVVTTSTLTISMATAVRMPTLPLRAPSPRLSGISGGWSGSSTQPTLSWWPNWKRSQG